MTTNRSLLIFVLLMSAASVFAQDNQISPRLSSLDSLVSPQLEVGSADILSAVRMTALRFSTRD